MADVDQLRDLMRRGFVPGRHSVTRFVLERGTEWPPAMRQDAIDIPRDLFQCWEKVEYVIATRPDLALRYVQGYALKPAALESECHEHAWLGTQLGEAVDVHWSDASLCVYFGVAVDRATFERAIKRKSARDTVLDFLVREGAAPNY